MFSIPRQEIRREMVRTRLAGGSLADVHADEGRPVDESSILLAIERRVRAEGEGAVLPAKLPDDVSVRAVDVVERAGVAYGMDEFCEENAEGSVLVTWKKQGNCQRHPCQPS